MLRLLLDTHAFVWCLSDVPRLAEGARNAIADPRNDVFVSAVTGWEISVKRAKGRMTAPDNLLAMVEKKGLHSSAVDLPSRRAGGTSADAPSGPGRPDADRAGPGRRARPRHQRYPHPALWHPGHCRIGAAQVSGVGIRDSIPE